MKGIVNNTVLAVVVSASLVGSVNAMNLEQVKETTNNAWSNVKALFAKEVKPQPKTYLEQAKELANSALSKTKAGIVNTPANVKALVISAKNNVKAATSSAVNTVATVASSAKNKAVEAGKSTVNFAKKSYNVSAQQVNNNKALIAASAAGAAAALAYKFNVVGKAANGVKAAYNKAKNNPKVVAAIATVATVPAVYAAVTKRAAIAENAHNVVPAVKAAYNYAVSHKASILAKIAAFAVSAAATFGITEVASK